MDTVLSHMEVDGPSANVNGDMKMGPVAPKMIQKQEERGKDKMDKLERKDKTEKKERKEKKKKEKGKSHEDELVGTKKRKHVEVNGDESTEIKKKKKKKSAIG